MTISIFGGRSSHGRSSTRAPLPRASPPQHRTSSRRTIASGRAGDVEEEREITAVLEQPDLNELRRRRLLYLAVSPEARRRASAALSTTVTRTAKASSDQKSVALKAARKSTKQSEHRQRRRRHKDNISRAEKNVRATKSSPTEDFVYARKQPESLPDRRARLSSSRTPKRSSLATLPAIVERDITPDDSISQLGVRSRPLSRRTGSASSQSKSVSTSTTRDRSIEEEQGDKYSTRLSARAEGRRSSQPSLLGLMRRHTAPAIPAPPRVVECLTCAADDVPYVKSAKLACGHRMCHDCLKRIFEMSVKDPAHMPPKCCTKDHIPLQHVDKLFDVKFKVLWNRKFQEYHTKNRIYCPAPRCGEWIKPSHVHSSQGKKYAKCPRCDTKVCVLCNSKLHRARECPKDPEIAKLIEQAKQKGWQTCFNCSAMVELKEGCNHMTCRCMAEFCMICGSKWKSCECPWFNYSQLPEPDRLMDWRVPEPVHMIFQRAFGRPEEVQPPPPPPDPLLHRVPLGQPASMQRRATYADELEQRRRQERLDADLARRLQLASLLEPEDEAGNVRQARVDHPLVNAAGRLLNDPFVHTAMNVVMDAIGSRSNAQGQQRRPARRRRAQEEALQQS